MKPYEIEIFDREFNYKYNALIDGGSFDYKFDVISPEKNTVLVPKDFDPAKLTEDVNAPKGWYIRILGAGKEWQGVITGFEKTETQGEITYSQLVTIFDCEMLVVTREILSTKIETYIKARLVASFVNNTDAEQNIYGLTANSINLLSQTEGMLPYSESDSYYSVIKSLDDLILAAAQIYNVYTIPVIDFQNKTVSVSVGMLSNTEMVIESDLTNVLDSSFTIKKITDEINRTDIYDEYYNTWQYYYLHSDGTSSQTDTDRVIPVNNAILTFNSYDLAKAEIDAKITNAQNTFDLYLSVERTLTESERGLLELAVNGVFDTIIKDKMRPKINPSYVDPALRDFYVTCKDSRGRYVDVGSEYDLTFNIVPTGFVVSTFSYYDSPFGNIILAPGEVWVDTTPMMDRNPYAYDTPSHVLLSSAYCEITVRWDSDPIREYGADIAYQYPQDVVYSILDMTEFRDHVTSYKKSISYENDIKALAQQITVSQAAELARESFAKNKYSNFIEVTVLSNDSMIKPMDLQIGQVVNIIHDGVSYNSILSGREIQKDGLVKLIFGTIRLELTKILNMKGI